MDRDTIRRIAFLARLKVSDEQLDSVAREIGGILAWIEQLGEVDTSGVDPMTGVGDFTLPRRPDEVTDGGYPGRILANAPEPAEGFFAVPKVVE